MQVRWLHRQDRTCYKAGALEAGRHLTDTDFVPPPDFLERAIPHFYGQDGAADTGLAPVQAQ